MWGMEGMGAWGGRVMMRRVLSLLKVGLYREGGRKDGWEGE